MRFGLLVPVGNDVLAFAFIVAIIITLLWFTFQAISHLSKSSRESTFNRTLANNDSPNHLNPQDLYQLLDKMPHRKASIDAGTLVFWTSDGPLAIAIARGSPQSSFKVFLRVNLSAGRLGHKITVSGGTAQSVIFKLTAESLIFSGTDSTLYDTDLNSLDNLSHLLKENTSSINNLPISAENAKNLVKWISLVKQAHSESQEKLLIGE